MFDKTIYGKEMEDLARKLADQIIQGQKEKQELEVVSQVGEDRNSYSTDKKGR